MANCVDWGPVGNPACCEEIFPYIDWTQSNVQLSLCSCGGLAGGAPTGAFRGVWHNEGKVYTTGGDFSRVIALQNPGPNTTAPLMFPTPFVGSPNFGITATTKMPNGSTWEWRSFVDSTPKRYFPANLAEDGFYISLPVTTTVTGGATTTNPDGFRHYNYGVIIGMRARYFCQSPAIPGYIDCDACDTTGLNTPCVPYGWYIHGKLGTVYQCYNYLKTPIGTLSFGGDANSPNYGQLRSFDGVIPTGFNPSTRTLYAMGNASVYWWWRGTSDVPWPTGDVGPRTTNFISGFTNWRCSVCGPLVSCDSLPTGSVTPLTDVDKKGMNANIYPTPSPVTGGTPAPLSAQPAPW